MTESDNRTAKAAAREALQEFLLLLGVDISTPGGVIELQKDFHHIRSARETVDGVRTAVRNKVVDMLTGGAVSAVIAGAGVWLAHH